jgi:hypothetical protein
VLHQEYRLIRSLDGPYCFTKQIGKNFWSQLETR